MKAFWFYGRFSVSKVTIDVPQISVVWLPRVKCLSALALKNEDSMNEEKHSLRNFAALQSRGSYSKKFLPTSIVTFDRKEANFENDIASEKKRGKKNFLRINALTNLI